MILPMKPSKHLTKIMESTLVFDYEPKLGGIELHPNVGGLLNILLLKSRGVALDHTHSHNKNDTCFLCKYELL
jgi:hypothetical protein